MSDLATTLPAAVSVLVCEVRDGVLHPMFQVDRRSDGHLHIVRGLAQVPKGLGVLQAAASLCAGQVRTMADSGVQHEAGPTPNAGEVGR